MSGELYGHEPHTHTQTEVQRLVVSKDRVETNGRTDGQTTGWTLLIASRLTRSVTREMCSRVDMRDPRHPRLTFGFNI